LNTIEPRGDADGHQAVEARCGVWREVPPLLPARETGIRESLRMVRLPLYMVEKNGTTVPESCGIGVPGMGQSEPGGVRLAGYAPPCLPENLGDPDFCADLGIRYPYLAGSMAKGISSVAMLEELGREGMLGFFGAAGLPLAEVEAAIVRRTSSIPPANPTWKKPLPTCISARGFALWKPPPSLP